MPSTYDNSLPTDKDKLRFLVQDTVVASAVFADGELTWLLSEYSDNIYRAAAVALRSLAADKAKLKSWSADGVSETTSPADLLKLADEYDRQAARRDAGLLSGVGVQSVVRKDGFSDDIAAGDTEGAGTSNRRTKRYFTWERG